MYFCTNLAVCCHLNCIVFAHRNVDIVVVLVAMLLLMYQITDILHFTLQLNA